MIEIKKIPTGEPISQDYSIEVNGVVAEAYVARVSKIPFNRVWPGKQRPLEQTELASFISIGTDETEDIIFRVEAKRDFGEAVVRPLAKEIKPSICGNNTVEFKLRSCGQYVLELDGYHKALHIFINKSTESPDFSDKKLRYFAPGVHDAGRILLGSGETLYIDDGAVVYASVVIKDACNVRIAGNGILDNSLETRIGELFTHDKAHKNGEFGIPYELQQSDNAEKNKARHEANGCLKIYRSQNVKVEGIVFRDSAVWTATIFQSDNVVFDNVKAIGMWRYNSDGIDFVNSSNGVVRNSFLRNYDDVIVLKGLKSCDTRNVENILIVNNVLWCDWGRGLEIGAETCADEYNNIIFRNNYLIHGAHMHMDIQNGDRACVKGLRFEDIKVEYSKYEVMPIYQDSDEQVFVESPNMPYLCFGEIYNGIWSKDFLFGEIRDIMFKNITVYKDEGMEAPKILFKGANEEHCVDGVTVENLVVNGEKVSEGDGVEIIRGDFAYNILIK